MKTIDYSLKRNYIYSVVYEILLIIIPLLTSPYISRVLGAEQVGLYSYSYSVVSYFVMFSRLGIVNHGSRAIASAKDINERSVIFINTFTVQIVLSVCATLLYIFYLNIFEITDKKVAYLMLLYLLSALFDINWFFFGIEEFKITVTKNILVKILNTILLFVFVRKQSDLWKYALILGACQFMGQIIIWPYLKDQVNFVYPALSKMKEQFLQMLVLFIPQIAVSLYKMMDKIMLGRFGSMEQLGYYEYASTIVNLPLGFITSLGTIMLPRISSMIKNGNSKKTLEYTRYSMIFAIALSSAFAFGLAAVAPTFIPFYLGREFEPTSKLLVGLSSTLIFLAWANVIRTQYLIPFKKDRGYIISLFSGAIVNMVINSVLIPRYYAWGAVIGTIAAELVVCIIQTFMSMEYLSVYKYFKENFIFIILGSLMFIIVREISRIPIPVIASLILQIVGGGTIYLFLSYLYCRFCLKIHFFKSHN